MANRNENLVYRDTAIIPWWQFYQRAIETVSSRLQFRIIDDWMEQVEIEVVKRANRRDEVSGSPWGSTTLLSDEKKPSNC